MKTVVEAKVFKNGGSNAIRIPAFFKVADGLLFLTIDDEQGLITISRDKPQKFAKLFELLDQLEPTDREAWKIERDESIWPERQGFSDLEARFK